MKKKSDISGSEIPLGLSMAFAQNTQAMKNYSALSGEKQQEIINKAKNVSSKQEMQSIVSELGAQG